MAHRILLVDDASSLVRILQFSLSDAGYEVQSATSAFDAMVHLSGSNRFDLVIVGDLKPIPHSSLGLINDIAVHFAHASLPILALSTQSSRQDIINAWMFGADWFMPKPFNLERLKATVEHLIHEAAA